MIDDRAAGGLDVGDAAFWAPFGGVALRSLCDNLMQAARFSVSTSWARFFLLFGAVEGAGVTQLFEERVFFLERG